MFIEKRFIVPFFLLLLIVGFVALLAIVGMTVRLGDRANEHFDEVISARDVRVSAVEIRSAVQSAESGQRGLLLTRNEIYLSPYDAAKTSANRQLEAREKFQEIASAAHPKCCCALRIAGTLLNGGSQGLFAF